MAGPSFFERLSNSRFGNYLKSAYQTISNLFKREKGNSEEEKPLLNPLPQNPEESKPELKGLEKLREVITKEAERRDNLQLSPTTSVLQTKTSEVTETTKPLTESSQPQSPKQLSPLTPETTTSPTPQSQASSREASYRVISMNPAAQKLLDSKIEQATKGITNKSEILRIKQTVKADFNKNLLTNNLELHREIEEKNLELQREASPTTSGKTSPTTSGNSSLTKVKSILRPRDFSGDSSPSGITWQDGGTKNTKGVEERAKLESPASQASPTPPSQARTAYAGSPPTVQFQGLEATRLAEAAAKQAQLSGRKAVAVKEDIVREATKKEHWKQVEAMRTATATATATAQQSVGESFFGEISEIVKKFSGTGGQAPVEPSTSAPAQSNQPIATANKSPQQTQKPTKQEYIPVFVTPTRGKENSGQGTSSHGSSNTGRTPLSPNNSSNGTGSKSASESSSSRKSVMVAGVTVKGTQNQVEAMQESLFKNGRSPNSVSDAESVIKNKIKYEDSAVSALNREIRKTTNRAYPVTSATVRENNGPGRDSKYGAIATSEGATSFNNGKGIGSSNNGNGNGGRGYTGR